MYMYQSIYLPCNIQATFPAHPPQLSGTVTRPGKRLQKANWKDPPRSTIFNGKIHYFYSHFQ